MAIEGGRLKNFFRKLKKAVRIALLLLFLLAGAVSGLFVGGGIYPIADRITPWVEKFPLIGHKVYPVLERISPSETSYERRRLELEEERKYLEGRSKALDAEKAELAGEKEKLGECRNVLAKQMADMMEMKKGEKAVSEEKEPGLFDMFSDSFLEMPPSKSAKVIALLPLREAVSVLENMDTEQRSQVLGKMSPEAAAKLVRFAKMESEGT